MSRTNRQTNAGQWLNEEYLTRVSRRYGITKDRIIARLFGDEHGGRRNAASWFRRQLNRLDRHRADHDVRNHLANGEYDIELRKTKRSANWRWF